MTRGSDARWMMAAVAAVLASCGGGPTCPSSEQARTELASLAAGGTMTIDGACVLSGSFVVPAGATLHGGTFSLAAGDRITLTPSAMDAPATTLESVHVVGGSSGSSVRVEGAGHARISQITLDVQRGYAIVVSGSSVAIDHVTVQGALDVAHIVDLGIPAPASANLSYGIVAIQGASIDVTTGDFSGIADAAVMCIDSSIGLSSLTIEDSRGVGVAGFACAVRAADLDIHGMIAAGTLPGTGIGLFEGSTLVAGDRLSIHDEPGYGVLADRSAVTLTDPTISGLGIAGVWVEDGDGLTLHGGTFEGNRGIAISAIGVASVDIRGTHVTSTANGPIPTMGGLGTATMADALHVVQRTRGVPIDVMLGDLVLSENARVGLVLDGGGDPLALAVSGTMVSTSGTELGAIAQNVASLPASWDSGITRAGPAMTLDHGAAPLVVSDGVGTLGILMPPTIMF